MNKIQHSKKNTIQRINKMKSCFFPLLSKLCCLHQGRAKQSQKQAKHQEQGLTSLLGAPQIDQATQLSYTYRGPRLVQSACAPMSLG